MLTFRHKISQSQYGATMIEVLITIVILAFGLLGLVGLQAKVQLADFESYQRAQAVVLLSDMVDRINANPGTAWRTAGGSRCCGPDARSSGSVTRSA